MDEIDEVLLDKLVRIDSKFAVFGLTASTSDTFLTCELNYVQDVLKYKFLESSVQRSIAKFDPSVHHISLDNFLQLSGTHALLIYTSISSPAWTKVV